MRRQTLVPTSDNSFLEQHTFALFLKPFFLRTSDVVVVSLSLPLSLAPPPFAAAVMAQPSRSSAI